MKKVIFALLVASLLPVTAIAKKTTYIVTNHRLNYVKLVEVKQGVAEARQMTHPVDIDEGRMRAILSSIKLSRGHLTNKEIDTDSAFDDYSINFLAPALVKAFRDAKPTDEVVISYLVKNPFFIIRNDRINIANVWVHENELHIKFQKLFAKVTGDIDKKGNFGKAVANAQGIRIALEMQPGQQLGDSMEEVICDLSHNFEGDESAIASAKAAETEKEAKSKKKSKKEIAKAEAEAKAEQPAAAQVPAGNDVKARLERLDALKKDKLISDKEYKEKKKEILKDL